MISGYERYFQIARCFRDEDLRANRQPEFTQIDVEMSFVQADDVFNVIEPLVSEFFKVAGIEPPSRPFPRMSYKEAMNRYGSDKPDLRFGIEFVDLSAQFEGGAFTVFADAVKKGYLRPVEITEVNEVKNQSTTDLQRDPAWKEKLDRYEARDSMGDPAAMALLSQIYSRGIGVQTDPRRAQRSCPTFRHPLRMKLYWSTSGSAAADRSSRSDRECLSSRFGRSDR